MLEDSKLYLTFTVSVISSRDSFERFSIQNLYSKQESLTVLIGRIYPVQLLLVKSGKIVIMRLFEFQCNETSTRLFSSFSTLNILLTNSLVKV